MTTFPCFNTDFDFVNMPAVADVQDIIDQFRTTALAQTPAWTEPVAETFKSPVDGVGRFYTITMSAIAVDRLQWLVKDQNGITIADRTIDIDNPGPTSVNLYIGTYHGYVESMRATPEIAASGILDETPLAQNAIDNYVYGNGYRNSGGAVDGQGGTTNYFSMLDNGAAAYNHRFRSVAQTPAGAIGLKDAAGNPQFFPCDTQANVGGIAAWIGRQYQGYICDSSLVFDSQHDIKIGDAGEEGTFRVINYASQTGMRQMLRVA